MLGLDLLALLSCLFSVILLWERRPQEATLWSTLSSAASLVSRRMARAQREE